MSSCNNGSHVITFVWAELRFTPICRKGALIQRVWAKSESSETPFPPFWNYICNFYFWRQLEPLSISLKKYVIFFPLGVDIPFDELLWYKKRYIYLWIGTNFPSHLLPHLPFYKYLIHFLTTCIFWWFYQTQGLLRWVNCGELTFDQTLQWLHGYDNVKERHEWIGRNGEHTCN